MRRLRLAQHVILLVEAPQVYASWYDSSSNRCEGCALVEHVTARCHGLTALYPADCRFAKTVTSVCRQYSCCKRARGFGLALGPPWRKLCPGSSAKPTVVIARCRPAAAGYPPGHPECAGLWRQTYADIPRTMYVRMMRLRWQ